MINNKSEYKIHEFEVVCFGNDKAFCVCAISGQHGSGTGTYSWKPDRSDS
ncbi:MAG: hypothetical protein LUH18_06060 [Oscillospiraceae bacterium]|nr:hypothetical protein [Oscillospiraceae bacterium]